MPDFGRTVNLQVMKPVNIVSPQLAGQRIGNPSRTYNSMENQEHTMLMKRSCNSSKTAVCLPLHSKLVDTRTFRSAQGSEMTGGQQIFGNQLARMD